MLSLMGIKPRHVHRIVQTALSQLAALLPSDSAAAAASCSSFLVPLLPGPTPFPQSSTLCLSSSLLLYVLTSALSQSKHFHPVTSPALLTLSHRIITRQQHIIVVLAGTSGTGKSTLASLLADRLGITTVIGSDSVRHVLRQRSGLPHSALLQLSSYQAYRCVPDDADVALLSQPYQQPPLPFPALDTADTEAEAEAAAAAGGAGLSFPVKVKLGHHMQSLLVCYHLHSLITSLVATRTSAIIEGVHLLPGFISFLQQTLAAARSQPTMLIPFLVYISNETKHRERFAVRSSIRQTLTAAAASGPSLHAADNPYIASFPAIRFIQKQLLSSSSQLMPAIDNTNMDRSVAAVHEIALHVMLRGQQPGSGGGGGGEEVLREVEEMRAEAWSSKAMQRVIRQKVEKRHLFERFREAERQRRGIEDDDELSRAEDDDANGSEKQDSATEGREG